MKKIGKCGEGQVTNQHTAPKITIRGDCWCFRIKAGTCINKRKPRFKICLTFCFVRNLDDSVELRQYQLLSQRTFFFLPKAFFRFWFFLELRVFHKQKVCTCEFVMYAMQTKYANNMKNEPQDEQKIPSGDASDTFLIYQLITQSTFFKITRVLFGILNLFLLETLGRMFEVCLVK